MAQNYQQIMLELLDTSVNRDFICDSFFLFSRSLTPLCICYMCLQLYLTLEVQWLHGGATVVAWWCECGRRAVMVTVVQWSFGR